MKLKYFIILGYLISSSITIISVILAVKKMLFMEKEAYIIILITLISSIIGIGFIMLLFSKIFKSLEKLKTLLKQIPNKQFDTFNEISIPLEFKEFAKAYNNMALNLKKTFESLEKSEKEKDLIIAQLSHDINTPLTSIQITIDAILDGVIQYEEKDYYLKTIKRQTARLNTLVKELNFITMNISNNKNNIKKEIICLDKLLIDILSEFNIKIEKENRIIDINVYPENTKIYTNLDTISRILLNIIENAFKYSKSGTKLTIKTTTNSKKLIISIKDEGIGIKKEHIELIFNRLYRIETSRNQKTGGYGLGLYIAQELAKQINGKIKVNSEYGQGSEFIIILDDIIVNK